MGRAIALVAVLMVCGCEAQLHVESAPPPPPPAKIVDGGDAHTNRFVIQTYGKFWAGYSNHEREVLVIHDRETGADYLAITGCGVSEMWTEHRRVGKTTHTVTVEE